VIPKGRFISELGDGDKVKAVFMVSERRLLTARNGKPYAKLMLRDKTGEILGFIWEDANEQMGGIEPGNVIGVRGSAESYENRMQVRIEKIVRLNESEVDMATLIPTTKGNREALQECLEKMLGTIQDSFLTRLIQGIMAREGFRDALSRAPAAKGIHHNYIGGLLEHTVNMLKAIDALYPVFSSFGLHRDLLIAGAFLHDIGKIYEYAYTKMIDMTPPGRLLGHVYISAQLVDQEILKIAGFPEELRMQLVHMILSHHGELEYGSPKVPMTKEAMFLHMIDDLDAKMAGFSSIIEATPDSELFSAFSGIYNRYLYTRIYETTSEDD
jgi:3'-5' exoribonuclease